MANPDLSKTLQQQIFIEPLFHYLIKQSLFIKLYGCISVILSSHFVTLFVKKVYPILKNLTNEII